MFNSFESPILIDSGSTSALTNCCKLIRNNNSTKFFEFDILIFYIMKNKNDNFIYNLFLFRLTRIYYDFL